MSEAANFYLKSVKEVFSALKTSEKGLSQGDAANRLGQYGENRLVTLRRTPRWLQFLLQFKEVLVVILVIAGVISFAIGNISSGAIMFIIVLINAGIGYFQEYKA